MTLIVNRWKRYGHDRLYCNEGERRLGLYDLKSGEVKLEDSARSVEVHLAISAYMNENALGQPQFLPPQQQVAGATAPAPAEPEDLADRLPGQGVTTTANAIYEAEVAESPILGRVRRVVGTDGGAAWRKGAEGERAVAKTLGKLGDQWTVLHSVPIGTKGTDIDHVVIGPGGVLTINTKNHQDQTVKVKTHDVITVNGRRHGYINASRSEAQKASRLLTAAVGWHVNVIPMLAIICRDGVAFDGPPPQDVMISSYKIRRSIQKLPERLTASQVAAIVAAARRPGTWTA